MYNLAQYTSEIIIDAFFVLQYSSSAFNTTYEIPIVNVNFEWLGKWL